MTRAAWRDVSLVDHFVGGTTETGEIGDLGWSTTAAGTSGAAYRSGEADHPGIFRVQSGAVSGNMTRIYLGAAGSPPVYVDNVRRFVFLARLQALSSATVRLGVGIDPTSATLGTAGAWFEYNAATGGNWYWIARTGGVSVPTDLGVAATTGWATLIAEQSAAGVWSVVATVGATSGELSVGGPTAVAVAPIVQVTTSTAAARNVDVDYFELRARGAA